MTQDPDNYREIAHEKTLEEATADSGGYEIPKFIPPSFALEEGFDEGKTLRIFMGDKTPLIDKVIIHGPAGSPVGHDIVCIQLYDDNTFKVLHGHTELTKEVKQLRSRLEFEEKWAEELLEGYQRYKIDLHKYHNRLQEYMIECSKNNSTPTWDEWMTITTGDEHDPDAWMGDESIEHFRFTFKHGVFFSCFS